MQKNLQKEETAELYLVMIGKQNHWLPSNLFARDADLSRTNSTQDLGKILTLVSSSLKKTPDWRAETVLTVPPKSSLVVYQIQGSWALVQFESLQAWIDLSGVLTKFDFASFVATKTGEWKAVRHREVHEVVCHDGSRIGLEDIRGLVTRPDLAISLETQDSPSLLLRQNFKILSTQNDPWKISQIKGHGLVYWKVGPAKNATATSLSDISIGTDEILKREIFSVAVHPQNRNIALVAAKGIFYTIDGKSWRNLPEFGDDNSTVAISPEGELFVGHHRSRNFGRSFIPYFKWEDVAQVITDNVDRNSQILKISDIKFLKDKGVKLTLDTGTRKVAVLGNRDKTIIQKWTVY